MNIKKNIRHTAVFSVCLLSGATIYGKAPETIRVGLESIYKDSASIVLKSDDGFNIGYFDETEWEEEGTLKTDELTIKQAKEFYTRYDESYRSYEEAEEALEDFDRESVIAYIEPNVYHIYTTDDAHEEVELNTKRMAIYDEEGELILISENDEAPLGFQGKMEAYDFPVTQVGKERAYRGVIEVVQGQYSGLTAVNSVDFEEYLYGVLNNEMSYTYPEEALKAQAVAARSMASYQYTRYVNRGYNLVDTVYSQVYKGLTSEHPITTKAVDDTRGEMAYYNDKVAETLYFASSGGHTEDAEYVWGNEVPYLKGVPDPLESKEDNRSWTRTITLEELEKSVAEDGKNIGTVKGVEIVEWTDSGRVKELHIIGSEGTYALEKEAVRTFFEPSSGGSLMSRMYKFEPYSATGYQTVKSEQTTHDVTTKSSNKDKESLMIQSEGEKSETDLSKLLILGEQEASFIDNQSIYIVGAEETVAVDPEVLQENQKDEEGQEEDNVRDEPLLEYDASVSYKPDDQTTVIYGDVTFYGKAYGHGVGMSQTGAKGMALAGYDYKDIIEYYYSGVEVK